MRRLQRFFLMPCLVGALLAGGAMAAQARPDDGTVIIDGSEAPQPVKGNDVVVQDDNKAAAPQIVLPPAAEGTYVVKPDGQIDMTASQVIRHEDPAITNDAEIVVFPSEDAKAPVVANKNGSFPPILVTVYRRVQNYTMVATRQGHQGMLASRAGRRPLAFYTKVAEKVDIAPTILKYSQQYNLDPCLVKAVIKTESGFTPRATSWCGAAGLMQLMPFTARRMGAQHIYDIDDNIGAGTRYLHYLMGLFGNRTELAVAAYNAGEGAVQNCGGIPHYTETQNYVRKVMSSYHAYKGE
ncbi:MAG TPA: lytic transglycosylase domain-containing protein [Candidatus Xenobia bacterium]|jgi:hypothetical protein